MRSRNNESRLPATSLPQMVMLGLCNESIVGHERPLPEEMDTMRNIVDYHRLRHIQDHGPSEDDVAWLAKAADDIKREVNQKFRREISDTRKLYSLDKVERPDILPTIQRNKREGIEAATPANSETGPQLIVTGGSYSTRNP
jgi:hypothetical protein